MHAEASERKAKGRGRNGKRQVPAQPRRVDRPDSEEVKTTEAALPLAAIALDLVETSETSAIVYVAADERRAETLGYIVRRLAPAAEVLVFPPWDCLPFDRTSPSAESMGRRAAVLHALASAPSRPRIVITTVEAALQRVPPQSVLSVAHLSLRVGDTIDESELRSFAERTGYELSDRVQDPGDIQFHGQVIEVFPPDARQPFRIDVDDNKITEISVFDPASQRSVEQVQAVAFGPASELVTPPAGESVERTGGAEHRLSEFYAEPLATVFDGLADAVLALAPETDSRIDAFFDQLDEAHQARISMPGDGGAPAALKPDRLYITRQELQDLFDRHEEREIVDDRFPPTPDFALEPKPIQAFRAYLDDALARKATVVLTGVTRDLTAFGRYLERHGGLKPDPAHDWATVRAAVPGSFLSLDIDIEEGVIDARSGIVLVAATDVLGTRAHREAQREAGRSALLAEPPMRIGDMVIHEDHGIGILRGLESVDVDGATQDAARIEYHGGASLLAPAADLDKLWRYGSDDDAVSLDRLHTDAWTKRRVEVEVAVRGIAEQFVRLAAERANVEAPKLVPPRRDYERFAARFPYPTTPDQARAIAGVLADLASGHPMDRLVCGDVGFGKTEVALRAAAAAALCGKQVAVVAPTTVLARQHLQAFQRRFAPFGIEVAGLSRLVSAGEAKRVKAGLADGSIRIVVGTQAVAGAGVTFDDLGLLVIDEEHKFGAKLKAELRNIAVQGHVLTLTATPIPRTLQMAMVGIQAVSVIATPPSRRRPIRTIAMPFDPASVRIALLREKARAGQSFVVVPRVEDIEPMREQLAVVVPELSVGVAHGGLPAEDVDQAMMGFADGQGDVLLATNIIESGLDVPRANTMLIYHADRFGLAQLHQLRGRVGRGRTQGVTYLLTESDAEIGEATQDRLATLSALDRLGAGLSISARDLDLRGAGDLVGDEQAGHMRLIGLGLYQTLLGRAVRLAKGEPVSDEAPPDLQLEMSGRIPDDYVAEPDLRIELYGRLARFHDLKAIEGFAEELEDRFGLPPTSVGTVLALARLRALCRKLDIAALSAGPRGIALTVRPRGLERVRGWVGSQALATLQGNKVVWETPTEADADRLATVEALLHDLVDIAIKPAAPVPA